jgi:hypothetical protein
MFVGHTAAALAAKAHTPRAPLGLLIGAAFFLDLLWPNFLPAGLEHVRIDPGNTAFTPVAFESYPWSHSLLLVIGWAALVAALAARAGRRVAAVVFVVVVSHWFLDVATHRPDLPLWPGSSPMAGLGLWNSVPLTLIVEGALFAGAILLYLRATPRRSRTGTIAFWSLVVFQTLIWISGPFSSPPPDATAIGVVGLALWLFPLWGWWIDRSRVADARAV